MTLGPLTVRFLDTEVTNYERDLLIRTASERTTGSEYFTFNVFNVRLDVDNQQVTVEDALDANVEETSPLSDFLSALTSMNPR